MKTSDRVSTVGNPNAMSVVSKVRALRRFAVEYMKGEAEVREYDDAMGHGECGDLRERFYDRQRYDRTLAALYHLRLSSDDAIQVVALLAEREARRATRDGGCAEYEVSEWELVSFFLADLGLKLESELTPYERAMADDVFRSLLRNHRLTQLKRVKRFLESVRVEVVPLGSFDELINPQAKA